MAEMQEQLKANNHRPNKTVVAAKPILNDETSAAAPLNGDQAGPLNGENGANGENGVKGANGANGAAPKAEEAVFTDFDRIASGKTAIYISHRLSSCRFCDEITVFEDGRIVQQGDHKTLLSQTDGKYSELWNAQAQYYQRVSAE